MAVVLYPVLILLILRTRVFFFSSMELLALLRVVYCPFLLGLARERVPPMGMFKIYPDAIVGRIVTALGGLKGIVIDIFWSPVRLLFFSMMSSCYSI